MPPVITALAGAALFGAGFRSLDARPPRRRAIVLGVAVAVSGATLLDIAAAGAETRWPLRVLMYCSYVSGALCAMHLLPRRGAGARPPIKTVPRVIMGTAAIISLFGIAFGLASGRKMGSSTTAIGQILFFGSMAATALIPAKRPKDKSNPTETWR